MTIEQLENLAFKAWCHELMKEEKSDSEGSFKKLQSIRAERKFSVGLTVYVAVALSLSRFLCLLKVLCTCGCHMDQHHHLHAETGSGSDVEGISS